MLAGKSSASKSSGVFPKCRSTEENRIQAKGTLQRERREITGGRRAQDTKHVMYVPDRSQGQAHHQAKTTGNYHERSKHRRILHRGVIEDLELSDRFISA